MKKFVTVSSLVAAALALTACGGDPVAACENYVDAWVACIDEAYADDGTTADSLAESTEGTCTAYESLSGSDGKEAAELLDCYADTIDAGDCSTSDGYSTTVSSITTECG